ncbi:uncharacterized mitochondrial protein AtMg00810-like [Carya illinoinensis]|uniref:uncharacterized mitochondrial protein AtMg00810-like n=1 Tax=Carya illinoinensis TaxID=32201 RepID=UPI001C71E46A|nr:uncharacterized mitochondrial protein AtMg00810-like [Carya illinoinensis]
MREPKGFKTTAKHPRWIAAMDEELQALHHNHTWDLVPRPANTNIVGSKWVFRIKYLANGSVDHLKARLSAKLVDSKPVSTPVVVAHHLSIDGPDFDDPSLFRPLVGALQYLTITRLDLAHAVFAVSQYMQKPSLCHFQVVKRILRYIKGTLRNGLSFTPSSSYNILAYSDVDWTGCPDTRRSIFGYAIYLDDKLVSWHSKKQPTVSRSSCESKYRALASTTIEVKWLGHLLHDLKVTSSSSLILLCDNQSSIFLATNPVSHNCSKHIELDYHFVHELVAFGELWLQYVPTNL